MARKQQKWICCPHCIKLDNKCWTWQYKLDKHPLCPRCKQPYPQTDPAVQKPQRSMGKQQSTQVEQVEEAVAKAKLQMMEMVQTMLQGKVPEEALHQIKHQVMPETKEKEPTLGEKSKARKDAKHKLDMIIKKVAQKRVELTSLEGEYVEALKKAEKAEEAYATAIKQEYKKDGVKSCSGIEDGDGSSSDDSTTKELGFDVEKTLEICAAETATQLQMVLDVQEMDRMPAGAAQEDRAQKIWEQSVAPTGKKLGDAAILGQVRAEAQLTINAMAGDTFPRYVRSKKSDAIVEAVVGSGDGDARRSDLVWEKYKVPADAAE